MRKLAVALLYFGAAFFGTLTLETVAASAQNAPPKARQSVPTAEAVRDRANENVIYLMGGQLGATYIQMAHDISVVTNMSQAVRVIPAVGGAAVQNIRDVLLLRGVDLGIASVQSIMQLAKSGEPGTEGLLSKVAYISILSADEFHVVARPEIKTIQDLAGKKVSFNNQGSSTALLAPQVFKALGVEVTPVYMAQGDALAAMQKGEVAATVCGCPKPVPAFASLKSDMGFSLIGLDYTSELEQEYLPATLSSDDYPQLLPSGKRINTVATNSILITYNWPKNSYRYARVEKFVDAFFTNFPEIQKPPRLALWKNVSIAGQVKGIQRFAAAQEWIERGQSQQAKSNLVTNARRAPVANPPQLDPKDNPQLWGEFLKWMNKKQ